MNKKGLNFVTKKDTATCRTKVPLKQNLQYSGI